MRNRTRGLAAVLLAGLAGCSGGGTGLGNLFGQPQQGQPVRGFAGLAAAEEPRAALVARDVLAAGGNAVDAAVAAALALSVTLPSRASLGGGGACLFHHPRRGVEAHLFPPGARGAIPSGTDRPAAVPLMARGLFTLHRGNGRLRFEEVVRPAEDLARTGISVSRALATDLAAVAGPLSADPAARAQFLAGGSTPPTEGQRLVQPDLAATLAQFRTLGVGDLHQGQLARRFVEASIAAGGGLTAEELRVALPRVGPAEQRPLGAEFVSVLPTPAGLSTLAAFDAARAGGAAPVGPGAAAASTALVVADRDGGAVACAFTNNNLFGTGRVASGTGILLAAAPGLGAISEPPLSALLLHGPPGRGVRHVAAGSGQSAAPAAAAAPLAGLLAGASLAAAVGAAPEPGRSVALHCTAPVALSGAGCAAAADPRGSGLGVLVSGQ